MRVSGHINSEFRIPNYELNRGFRAAVGAEIGGAVPAAAAFPRLHGSFHAAFGTEIGTVFLSAYTAPFVAVPHRSSFILGSHVE